MTVTHIGRRLVLVGLLALVASLLPFSASQAQDDSDDSGDTENVYLDLDLSDTSTTSESVQTSILFSQLQFPDTDTPGDTLADDVILATDADGADALAAGSIQDNAPLLYFNPDTGVETAHIQEITRLGASRVIIVGESDAIDTATETAINGLGLLTVRLGGDTRIETANEVADFLYCRNDSSSSTEGNCEDSRTDTGFVESDDTANDTAIHLSRAFGTATDPSAAFADAAGLGAWAAQSGVATVLTDTAQVLPSTAAFYMDTTNDSVTRSVTIGGPAAVSDAVLDTLEEEYDQDVDTRVSMPDMDNRAGTAIAVNGARGLDTGSDSLLGVVFVEGYTGDFFIDAYALAGLAGVNDHAVVLVNDGMLPPESLAYVEALDFTGLNIFATPNVSEDGIAAIEAATGQTLDTLTYSDAP
ncbi:cell wall-binding repeat-containing protein [Euzebya tangerina]|uniref:cell wall-binding repeat-containing protein n=1 Tax=Euzebya tangerina TaxID=591198 RepID=UPI000E321124|nr:cell wall-binding repeat-containing protein [Euzebya tangerina]